MTPAIIFRARIVWRFAAVNLPPGVALEVAAARRYANRTAATATATAPE
ncbi:MAG: hypothetical protein ACJA0V_003743 [Planctomycetota bacterium]